MRWGYWVVMLAMVGLWATAAVAEEVKAPGAGGDMSEVYRTVGLAASAALVTAVSIIGAGYAVGHVGSAALGAVAEKPEILGRSLLFVALAEGLAVLGFAVGMMLVSKIG